MGKSDTRRAATGQGGAQTIAELRPAVGSPTRRVEKAVRFFLSSQIHKMVKIDTIKAGDGVNFPKKGDTVTMHYVGLVNL